MPGPSKTPAALNKLRGNPGRRKINENEPDFSGISTTPPSFLGKVGKAKWRERIKVLTAVEGLVTQADYDALATYCSAYEDLIEADKQIKDEGPTIVSSKGATIAHPAVRRKQAAIDQLLKIGGKFGMNPSDRQSLSVGSVEDKGVLSQLIRERGNLN